MLKRLSAGLLAAGLFLTGCATVPMAPKEQDASRKLFSPPTADKSGIYIYRDSFAGVALKKNLYIDGKFVAESANRVYFYQEVAPGAHKIATESEFSNNEMDLRTEGGKNYFVEQYIKMGVFVGGANVEAVSEEKGKKGVLACSLAYSRSGNYPAQVSSTTSARTSSSVQAEAASKKAVVDSRYLFQAEKVAMAMGCTATTFTSSGPGVELYNSSCGEKSVSIRCDFGKCAAQ